MLNSLELGSVSAIGLSFALAYVSVHFSLIYQLVFILCGLMWDPLLLSLQVKSFRDRLYKKGLVLVLFFFYILGTVL